MYKTFYLSAALLAAAASHAGYGSAQQSPAGLTIVAAERLTLHIPFYCERVTRHMHRANSHDERVILYRIELSNGVVGWGECPPNMSALPLEGLIGKNPFEFITSSRIRFGVQMALMDAVGRTVGVPLHKLIGTQVRDRVPIAWWMIDMPPEDWAAEVAESVRRGYTSAKIKARPWRDLHTQLEAVAAVAPADYRVVIDYNGFLLSATNALTLLKQIENMALIDGHESPYYFSTDLAGVASLTNALTKRVVDHFQNVFALENVGDGYLLAPNFGTLETAFRQESLCAARGKPYWLQMVGTGITAAYMAHLGSVLSHARLPGVTCHELWEDDLLQSRLEVVGGMMRVPEGPGLGVEVDEAAIRRYQVDPAAPTPKELYRRTAPPTRIRIPDGAGGETVLTFADESVYYPLFLKGDYPGFVRGVTVEIGE